MTSLVQHGRDLPQQQWDTIPQFAARIGVSSRTIIRRIESGLRGVIRIAAEPSKRALVRIDPQIAMADLRGELPPPEPVRRGRPKKRDDRAAASATAAVGTPRHPKLRLRHRTRGSL
jgi:hypothetical protein